MTSMKKILTVLLAFAMLFSLAACSEAQEVSGNSGPGFSAADLSLSHGGSTYKCDVHIEDVISALGEGYTYSEAMSCAYDGLDKVYSYESEGADFSTRPDGDRDLVCEIYVYSGDWQTSKGIKIGSTADDVTAVYGEPSRSTNFVSYYELPASNDLSTGASLYFEYMDGDGVVTSFGIVAEQLIGEE